MARLGPKCGGFFPLPLPDGSSVFNEPPVPHLRIFGDDTLIDTLSVWPHENDIATA